MLNLSGCHHTWKNYRPLSTVSSIFLTHLSTSAPTLVWVTQILLPEEAKHDGMTVVMNRQVQVIFLVLAYLLSESAQKNQKPTQ